MRTSEAAALVLAVVVAVVALLTTEAPEPEPCHVQTHTPTEGRAVVRLVCP